MRVSVRIDSAAAQAQLRRWGGDFRAKARKAAARAMAGEAAELTQAVRDHVAGQMRVVKRSFLKGFTAKVLDKDPKRLPALYVGSRIPWSGMHERGGVIAGRLLIPLYGRVGRKRFKAQIADLMRGGNAYFVKNDKGNVVLMAENIREHDRPLAGFKRRYRKAEGVQRIKRGADIPIAVLVPRVVLRKRLDIEQLVARRIPRLAAAVEARLREAS
ncbi:phosphopantetheine adenylyltransferase [Ralstonia solanacearum]|nr:phosphopantetheine adenylyltransferase [Ralstonia solanacearum]